MGKRSSGFVRAPRDWYPTPKSAVAPLLPHLRPGRRFAELCAGDGALVGHLVEAGHECAFASDIHPLAEGIATMDALGPLDVVRGVDLIITNPPWDRPVLHAMIPHFIPYAPTWFLLDADWIHTKQATSFMPMLRKIVSVGRVKWQPDSKHTGKDNCAWHLFGAPSGFPADFFGREA